MSGNGRLFAGCSDNPGAVHELDAATGAVLASTPLTFPVYGLSVDADSLYISGYFAGHVGKITLGGALDMQVAWTISATAPYGIACPRALCPPTTRCSSVCSTTG